MIKLYRLAHETARRRAIQAIADAPDGYEVTIGPPRQSRAQQRKYHAMLDDIAEQVRYAGRRFDADSWKRILVASFVRDKQKMGDEMYQHYKEQFVPTLDGEGVVYLGAQTRDFRQQEAAEFIEYLYAFGAENNVQWRRI